MTDWLEPHHWIFDGIVERSLAATVGGLHHAVLKLLRDLVRAVEMIPIAAPAFSVDEISSRWAGFQLIAESHISIHGRARYVAIDIFSCKPVNLDRVSAVLSLWFGDAPLFVSQPRAGAGASPGRAVVRDEPAFVLLRGRLWLAKVVELVEVTEMDMAATAAVVEGAP